MSWKIICGRPLVHESIDLAGQQLTSCECLKARKSFWSFGGKVTVHDFDSTLDCSKIRLKACTCKNYNITQELTITPHQKPWP